MATPLVPAFRPFRWALAGLIAAVAAGQLAYLAMHWLRSGYSLGADGREYWDIGAKAASQWGWFWTQYDSYFPPLWPAVIGAFRSLFGPRMAPIQLLNLAALGAIASALVRAGGTGIRFNTAALAALFALASLQAANNVVFLQYELLNAGVAVWGVWALAGGRGFWTGLAVAATTFLQPKILPFWIAAAFCRAAGEERRRALLWLARALGPALLLMALWGMRNQILFGHFHPVSSNGGINLYIGNNPLANGGYCVAEHLPGWPSVPYGDSGYYTRAAVVYAFSHPGRTLGLAWRKTVLFWSAAAPEDWWLLPGLILCLALKESRRRVRADPFCAVLAVWLSWTYAIHVITFADTRFRFGAMPAVCALAAIGWSEAWRKAGSYLIAPTSCHGAPCPVGPSREPNGGAGPLS